MSSLAMNPNSVPYFGQYYDFNKNQTEINKLHEPQLIILPYWIKQLLDRNKLNYIDILDYDKVRKLMSIEDVATFIGLNNSDYLKTNLLGRLLGASHYLKHHYLDDAAKEQVSELQSVIIPLSQSEIIYKTIIDRLSLDNIAEKDCTSSEDLYSLQINNDSTIFLFVKKGILNALEDRDYAKKLISAYLRALYSLIPINEVSYTDAFKLYLALI